MVGIKRWLALTTLALSMVQCRKPLTVLLVEIDTDVPLRPTPPIPVREIVFTGRFDWDGVAMVDGGVPERVEITRGAGMAQACLPVSFGAQINPGHEGQQLTLLVESASGQYRRIVKITPIAYRQQILRIRLHSACLALVSATASTPCPAGAMSCTLALSCEQRGLACGDEGTCVSQVIDATPLERVPSWAFGDSMTPPPVDGACVLSDFGAPAPDVPNASMDASMDASRDVPSG
jgi:hypothetical protein